MFLVNNSIRNLTLIIEETEVTMAAENGGLLTATTKSHMLYFIITNITTSAIIIYR